MRVRLSQLWRFIGTVISFTFFGLGCLLFTCIVAPIMYLTIWHQAHRTRFTRTLIQRFFLLFIIIMRGLGVCRARIHHRERLNRSGLLVVANHPSLIDTIFLLAHVKNASCVVKEGLVRNPITRGPIRLAGYLANSDNVDEFLDNATSSLNAGSSLIIFPEGTRTSPDKPIRMHRGCVHIALRAKIPITPVVISCQPATLNKQQPWYRIPPKRVTVTLGVQPDLSVNCDNGVSVALTARRFTEHLNDFFNKAVAGRF